METQGNFAPYAPTENVLRVLSKVRESGLKGPIDTNYLIQLGINESMGPRTIRALEFLGLLNADGSGTDELDKFIVAPDEEAPQILSAAITRAYATILRAVNPAVDSRPKVFTAFRTMKPQGQWDRMVTLFLGLCRAAGMEVKDAPPNRGPRAEGSRDGSRRTVPKAQPRRPEQPEVSSNEPPEGFAATRGAKPLDPALQSFLNKVRDVETIADLEAWFSAFRIVFIYVKQLPH